MQIPARNAIAASIRRKSARSGCVAATLLILLTLASTARSADGVSLSSLPDDHFTLQLIALPDREALERFVSERGVSGLMASPVMAGDEVRYALFLGAYPTREAAEEAARDLPVELADLNPWIRPIRSLRQAVPPAADAVNETTPEPR